MKAEAGFAREIVTDVLQVVRAMQGNVAIRDKGGTLGPVTDADLLADRMLVEAISKRFPEDQLLSEESFHDIDRSAARIWCVDPIDGTREYIKGLDEWAVMVGLLENGVPAAGALALPGEGLVFWGGRGAGVFREDEPITMAAHENLEDAVAIHSRSHREGNRELRERLGITKSVRAGGVGYKVAQLLLGESHIYFHAAGGTTWWDSVAPAALVLAAGGYVGNARGAPLNYRDGIKHKRGLLFAAPGLGQAAAQRLNATS